MSKGDSMKFLDPCHVAIKTNFMFDGMNYLQYHRHPISDAQPCIKVPSGH